jgi:hypothetical protein
MSGPGRLWPAVVALAILVVVTTGAPLRPSTPAYACTGGPEPLEDYISRSDTIAIIDVLSVEGPENLAPILTPTGNATPAPGSELDLTGYGAHVQVSQLIKGSVPLKFDLDTNTRWQVETDLRLVEAGGVPPCEPGFLVPKYAPGASYLVFMTRDKDGLMETVAHMYVDGANAVVNGDQAAKKGGPLLLVTGTVRRAFFAELPGENRGTFTSGPQAGEEEWRVAVDDVSLQTLIAAIKGISTGDIPATATPQPAPVATVSAATSAQPTVAAALGHITPPDTGDAGLK